MHFETNIPNTWRDLKAEIFKGSVFIAPPTASSIKMVESLHSVFEQENGYRFTSDIHEKKSFTDIMTNLGKARAEIIKPRFSMPLIHDVLRSFKGAEQDHLIGDVLRLRAMPHDAHNNGLSPHSTSAHRDCWYANPQSQINIWVPLLDVTKGNSFAFYPRYFDQAIENSSANFDYDTFQQKAGFQSASKIDQSLYPTPTETIEDGNTSAFSAIAGSLVLFSPSHLPQTVLNESGQSRFSVDFRVISQNDIGTDIGAPNVDKASTGNAAQDYWKVAPKQ